MTESNANIEPLPEAMLDEAAEWLVRLNESTASPAEFEEWQRWLGADASHARAFQALESTWRLSAQAAIAHHSRVPVEVAHYRPEEPVAAWVRRHHFRRRRRTAVAAAAAFAFLAIMGAWWSRQPAVIETATAEQRVVWLPDRSRVTVGPRTRLSYRYATATRALTLDEGQAFFEVTKDAQRPFVVETRRGRIIAVGTAFSVDAMPDRLNVTVAEGTVRIENAGLARASGSTVAGAAIMVSAGRRYVSATDGASVTPLPSTAPDVSWRDGRLAFYGDPLSAVIADLNRYAPDRIELAEHDLGELQYTGTVFPENVNDWLNSLPNIFPVRIERRARGWLIVRRGALPPLVTSRER